MEKTLFQQLALKLQDLSEKGTPNIETAASPKRKEFLSDAHPKKSVYSPAAVLICCYPNAKGDYLFPIIKRQDYSGVHSNQMGLPGGKPIQQDNSLWQTALRECDEELGIHSSKIIRVGTLSDVLIPPSQFKVTPFVAQLDFEPNIVLDNREIAKFYQLSLKELVQLDISHKKMILDQKELQVPGFEFESEFIWGATAMMLYEFKETLKHLIK